MPKQNNQASHTEKYGCTHHTVSWNTGHKGTSGYDQTARQKARRPNSDTMARRQILTWDVTVVSTLAASCSSSSAQSAGAAADLAASRKQAKYASLTNSYIFQPIEVESHVALNASAVSFLTTSGERLTGTSGDLREMSYLFQRLSVIVQRFNSVLIHESFVPELHTD